MLDKPRCPSLYHFYCLKIYIYIYIKPLVPSSPPPFSLLKVVHTRLITLVIEKFWKPISEEGKNANNEAEHFLGCINNFSLDEQWHRGLNPFWPHKFGFKPLLRLEPIRDDQKPRGPPLTCLTLWANLALASMY